MNIVAFHSSVHRAEGFNNLIAIHNQLRMVYVMRSSSHKVMILPALMILILAVPGSFFHFNVSPMATLDSYQENDIIEDTTWTTGDSPYIINSTIRISSGNELNIEEGVEVNFGSGARLIVDGSLKADGMNDAITFGPISGSTPGSWYGIEVTSEGSVFLESVDIIGAYTAFNGSSALISVSNSTIASTTRTAVLDDGSIMSLSNATFDNTTIFFLDNDSAVGTSSLLEIHVVDISGDPNGDVNVGLYDRDGLLWMSHQVNDTGVVPEALIRGYGYDINGTNISAGQYDVIMTDVPFTHFNNRTLTVDGNSRRTVNVRFSWPPEMTNIPERFITYEDNIGLISTTILDRNQVGGVDLSISSPNVAYDPDFKELTFIYEDENITSEIVYLNLSDGHDDRSYAIDVVVALRDDPPVFTLPYTLLYIREGFPYPFTVHLEDEDTDIENITMETDDPDNITVSKSNRTFVMLYGDGSPLMSTVNLTVGDGNTNITKEVTIFFEPVYYPPEFLLPFPEVVIDEDSSIEIDMIQYLYDPDQGDELELDIRVEDYDLFSASLNGTVINISSLADTNGHGRILVKVIDERNMTDSEYLNVTVNPVNDAPNLIDHQIDRIGGMTYRFNVTYVDIDGDLPVWIHVIIDGNEHDLSVSSLVEDGMLTIDYHGIVELTPGDHTYSFNCSDGHGEVGLGPYTILVVEPVDILYLDAYGGWLNITIWYRGDIDVGLASDVPGMVQIGDDDVVVASFSITLASGSITDILVLCWINELRSDILGEYSYVLSTNGENVSQVLGLDYDRSLGVLSFHLGVTEIGKEIFLISLLDPDLDSDLDGYKNLIDDFPNDPSEWLDTDEDGIGDNADLDDDGDGFSDLQEIDAGTDHLSATSYPLDTDHDGIFDHVDEDDDNDDMPDDWEIRYGLDPLDPSDASIDSDNDGITNLDEYLNGTDPLADLLDNGENGSQFSSWVLILIASVLIMLVGISVFLFLISSKKQKEEIEEDWSIRGELDPDDAVDCPACSKIYPLKFEDCPFCGEENPYNGDVE